MSLIFFLILVATSSLEQRLKVSASVNPLWATSALNWSVSLFKGNCLAMVMVLGMVLAMLL